MSNRSRSEWLAGLLEVASAETAVAAAELAFGGLERLLGFDRAALLRFDTEAAEVLAATVEFDAAGARVADQRLSHVLRVPGVVHLPGDIDVAGLFGELGIVAGVALPVRANGGLWGTLVVGHHSGHDLDALTSSMLESLASTLGIVIGREEVTQRLEQSNRRLETYAHAAAHDLRSPLRRIRSFSQILRARLEVEEIDRVQVSDFADRIANGAERLDALLATLLEHASIGAQAAESHEYTDLQATAKKVCDGISELSQEPVPSFVITGLPEVRLPADAAERALSGLVENALLLLPLDRAVTIEITSTRSADGTAAMVMEFPIAAGRQT